MNSSIRAGSGGVNVRMERIVPPQVAGRTRKLSLCKRGNSEIRFAPRSLPNKEPPMPLTEEEFEELEETFAYNDANNDGKIEYQEFLAMLEALEAGMKPDEARVGFDEIDTDNDGSIELDEFIDWWRDS
jgi:hypothetical protein